MITGWAAWAVAGLEKAEDAVEVKALRAVGRGDAWGSLRRFSFNGFGGPDADRLYRAWQQELDARYRLVFGDDLRGQDWVAVLDRLEALQLVIANSAAGGQVAYEITPIGQQVIDVLDRRRPLFPDSHGLDRFPMAAVEEATVYIAHSHKDNGLSTPIESGLRREGFRTWYDLKDIKYGNSLIEKMNYGLAHCSAFLLLWSAQAKDSGWVRREIEAAMVLELAGTIKTMLVVMLDDTPLSPLLAPKKYSKFDPMLDQMKFIKDLATALLPIS